MAGQNILQKCVSNLSYEGKKRGCEVDCPVIIYWLVHPDQLFESQAVRTLASKSERGINILQHVVHLRVVNTAPEQRNKVVNKDGIYSQDNDISLCAGVILRPDPDEFVEVVGSEDGGVSGQIVEVVHNDSYEEIEHEEAAEEDEGDEEEVCDVTAAHLARLEELARGLVPLDGAGVADLARPACQHDVWPRLSRGASEN